VSRDLIIIGAGGDGRNAADIAQEPGSEWNLLGFVDDDPKKQGLRINGVPVLGTTADLHRFDSARFVVLVGHAENWFIGKKRVRELALEPERYATIVHHTSIVSKHATIGPGSVILPLVTVMANAEVGSHTFIASKANVGHDSRVGDYASISVLTVVAGNVTIEEGAYVGMGVSIRGGITVGKWSIVGMGSVVTSDVPAYHVVAGVPARVIKKLDPSDFQL